MRPVPPGTSSSGSRRAPSYVPCKQSTKTSKDWALNNQLLPVWGDGAIDRHRPIPALSDGSKGPSVTSIPSGVEQSALLVLRQIDRATR